MTPQQRYALMHFLSQIPDTDDWDEAIDQVANMHNIVTPEDVDPDEFEESLPVVWEPFENYPTSQVAEWIQDMADELTELFEPKDEPIQL